MVTYFSFRPACFFSSKIFPSIMCLIIISDPFGTGFLRTLYYSYISSLPSISFSLLLFSSFCHFFLFWDFLKFVLHINCFGFFNVLFIYFFLSSWKVIHVHCRQIQKENKNHQFSPPRCIFSWYFFRLFKKVYFI